MKSYRPPNFNLMNSISIDASCKFQQSVKFLKIIPNISILTQFWCEKKNLQENHIWFSITWWFFLKEVFSDCSSLLLLFGQFIRNKLLTPLPNEGTESACSPRPTRKWGPQLEPMLKQNLNFYLMNKFPDILGSL